MDRPQRYRLDNSQSQLLPCPLVNCLGALVLLKTKCTGLVRLDDKSLGAANLSAVHATVTV